MVARSGMPMKPIMKWAGGKSQMLGDLMPMIPEYEGKYIEPFFGGGALFFALRPESAIIADSNPELINMYLQVAESVDDVIAILETYKNDEDVFYAVRSQDWRQLSEVEAAARTLYLNKTCFNGLYRVNRQGMFNTPFGRYKNPKICDGKALREASALLKRATILCGDYLDILHTYAMPGDFVFLDPPYIPISNNSDFKRYTPVQFTEDDHRALANEVQRLHEIGCDVILTNSDHPLVYELYNDFDIQVVETRRSVAAKPSSRRAKDVIVTSRKRLSVEGAVRLSPQVFAYPPTRFMGSKNKLLTEIWTAASEFHFKTVLDLFSGSGAVSYMFKSQGKRVICNDYMAMAATFSKAMIENNSVLLPLEEAKSLLERPLVEDEFVQQNFSGLYYSDEDNKLIDTLRVNIWAIEDEYKRAIALTALIRACIKKRPRGIFTYTGHRYNDGRRDLAISFEQQFIEAVEAVNNAVFDNGQENLSLWGDAMSLRVGNPDLVYIDPPYYSPLSDNEYVRRYHFVEGLARDWNGVEIQEHTRTKKFRSYPTPFSKREGASMAFDQLFSQYRGSILLVSYSSNSLPTKDEIAALMAKYKRHVEVIPIEHVYSFGNQASNRINRNSVTEFLFVGSDGDENAS